MKRKALVIITVCLCVFIFLMIIVFRIRSGEICPGPKNFEMLGIHFNLPDNFSATFKTRADGNEMIFISNCDRFDRKEIPLVIGRNTNHFDDGLEIIRNLELDDKILIHNYKEMKFHGQASLFINLNNRVTNKEEKTIYVLSKDLMLLMTDENRESFKQFDPVLESIRFVDDEKADRK